MIVGFGVAVLRRPTFEKGNAMETWQQWFDGKDFGSRTWMAGIARPYKLDQQYGFGLVSGATGTTYGKLVDANKHELVFEVDAGDGARLVIVGRCAITAAVEVETPNVK